MMLGLHPLFQGRHLGRCAPPPGKPASASASGWTIYQLGTIFISLAQNPPRALLGAHADRVLIGACDPMLCPAVRAPIGALGIRCCGTSGASGPGCRAGRNGVGPAAQGHVRDDARHKLLIGRRAVPGPGRTGRADERAAAAVAVRSNCDCGLLGGCFWRPRCSPQHLTLPRCQCRFGPASVAALPQCARAGGLLHHGCAARAARRCVL